MSYTRPSASAAFASWSGVSAYAFPPANSASAAWVDASEFSVSSASTPEIDGDYIVSASGVFDVACTTDTELDAGANAICAFRSVAYSSCEGVARVIKDSAFNAASISTVVPIVVRVTDGVEEQMYADINMRCRSRTIMRFRSGPWPW